MKASSAIGAPGFDLPANPTLRGFGLTAPSKVGRTAGRDQSPRPSWSLVTIRSSAPCRGGAFVLLALIAAGHTSRPGEAPLPAGASAPSTSPTAPRLAQCTSSTSRGESYEGRVLARTLQGIVTRKVARLYLSDATGVDYQAQYGADAPEREAERLSLRRRGERLHPGLARRAVGPRQRGGRPPPRTGAACGGRAPRAGLDGRTGERRRLLPGPGSRVRADGAPRHRRAI